MKLNLKSLALVGTTTILVTLSWACSTAKTNSNTSSRTPGSTSESDLIRSDFAANELTALCQKAIDQAQARIDAIATLKPDQRSFDNTVLALEEMGAELGDTTQPLGFMKYVSPVESINAEGALCEKNVGDFAVKLMGRRDLYNAIKDQHPRNREEARLLKQSLEDFEANGLKLPDDKLAQVTQLMGRLNELQASYSDKLNSDNTRVEFTREELDGVSDDFLARLGKSTDGSRFVATTKVTDFNQIMQNAKNAETRRKMAFANRQAGPNSKLLEDALQVRRQIAKLMGYATWADFQLSNNRMAKNSKTVQSFLGGLKKKLALRNQKDIQQLLEFKKSYEPAATQVTPWDLPYLSYQLQKRDYSLDNDQIREYFPSDHVVKEMFEVYSEILGVRFEKVQEAHSWSPNVQLYRIIDQKESRLIGHFYTDFIPRQGKYGAIAAFTIISGRRTADGYSQPISAIVGNFNPPTGGKPSLLTHNEVRTLFHEFGHIMHQTLTRAPYASLSGSNTARDFVEAPSQMLENWAWEEKILNRISGHYQDPSRKLPKDLLDKLITVRDFQQGHNYTYQLMLSTIDMALHTSAGLVDSAAIYNQIYREVLGLEPIESSHFPSHFGAYLMGGYDAGYYSYLWSQVYAQDIYTKFQSADPLDPVTGARYRRTILEQGNMENADALLKQFLGRPSNNRAFLKKLGISGK